MIEEESACKHPRNLLEGSFNPPKPWLREVTASPAELAWQGEHAALIAEGKGNKTICSPRCPGTTPLAPPDGCTVLLAPVSHAPHIGHGHLRHRPRLQGVPSSCTGRVTSHRTSGDHLALITFALKDDPEGVRSHH